MSNASLAVKPNNQTPYDISDAQLAKVKEWLFKLRPQISVFSEQNQGLVNALDQRGCLGDARPATWRSP